MDYVQIDYVQIDDVNISGTLQDIKLRGTAPGNSVAIVDDLDTAMYWAGKQVEGREYFKNQISLKEGWLAVVTADSTYDSIVPSTDGTNQKDGPDTFSASLTNTGLVVQQLTVEYTENRVLTEVQVYVEDVSVDLKHSLIVTDITSEAHQAKIVPVETLTPGWVTVSIENVIINEGTILQYGLLTENVAANTSWVFPWTYTGAVEETVNSGEYNVNTGGSLFRISFTDFIGTYQKTNIDALLIGSTLRSVSQSDSTVYNEYTITEVRPDNVSDTDFVVVKTSESGTMIADEVYDITGTTNTAGTTPYYTEQDYWLTNQPSWGIVTGGLILSGNQQSGVQNNAYGIRVFTQNVNISPDWQILVGNVNTLGTPNTVSKLYGYTKVENVTVINNTFQEVARVDRTVRDGLYELKISFTFTLDSTHTSAIFRFSIDGGTSWDEFSLEGKDVTDRRPIFYAFPYVVDTGQISFILEARKENAGDVMIIEHANLIVDQKG